MNPLKRALAALTITLLALVASPVAHAETPPPPGTRDPLEQTVRADEGQGKGRVELTRGHADIGPRMTEAGWKLMARDDTANPPVWRDPAEVVFRVKDAALLEVPADKQYEFLGIPAGKRVYVVPQTQNQSVIWLGWNTQDPAVTKLIDRGATLIMHRITGPGSVHVFLQNGFDAPQPLWASNGKPDQEIWVDVNTHTHANWVFSEPGIYLMDMSVKAKGVDGREYADRATLRFAVGEKVSVDEAFAAQFPQTPTATLAPTAGTSTPTGMPSEQNSQPPAGMGTGWVPWAAGAGVVVLALAAGMIALRGRKTRATALAEIKDEHAAGPVPPKSAVDGDVAEEDVDGRD